MSESVEVRLARLETTIDFLVSDAREAKETRKSQYQFNEANKLAMQQMAQALASLTETMNEQKPTIKEFITIKHKVAGAGKLGSILWAIGGATIGAISGIFAFVKWFMGAQ